MIIVSLGKKGSGKSALLRKLAWACLRAHPRTSPRAPIFLWHDPGQNIAARPGLSHRWQSVAEFAAGARAGHVVPINLFPATESPEALCALAVRARDCTVILDEFDRATDGKKWLAPSAERIVNEGRHLRVSLWGTFRRTANVPEDLLTAADFVFIFRHSEFGVYDMRGLEQRVGPHYTAAIQALAPMHFVAWRDV